MFVIHVLDSCYCLGYLGARKTLSVLVRKLDVSVLIAFLVDRQENAIATIVVRGSTNNVMDDIERAVDDGVNTYKALTKVSLVAVGVPLYSPASFSYT